MLPTQTLSVKMSTTLTTPLSRHMLPSQTLIMKLLNSSYSRCLNRREMSTSVLKVMSTYNLELTRKKKISLTWMALELLRFEIFVIYRKYNFYQKRGLHIINKNSMNAMKTKQSKLTLPLEAPASQPFPNDLMFDNTS